MNKSSALLKKYASSGSMFVKLQDGEEIKAKFLGAEEIPNTFDGGKTEIIRYHLEINGIVKFLDRYSRKLAKQMAEISEGEFILVKRIGNKNQTGYFVRRIEE